MRPAVIGTSHVGAVTVYALLVAAYGRTGAATPALPLLALVNLSLGRHFVHGVAALLLCVGVTTAIVMSFLRPRSRLWFWLAQGAISAYFAWALWLGRTVARAAAA